MHPINRRSFASLCAGTFAGFSTTGYAQARPELAKIFVPFPAGGTTDTMARLLAEQLRGDIADTVVVENKTGAAGRIAIQALRAAPADGLTLMLHASGIQSMYPHVLKQPGYDPFVDVAPVSTLTRIEACYVVGPAVPASVKTLQEYLVWARADNRNATVASPGPGSPHHLFAVVLGQQAKVDLAVAHYRGSTAAFPDVLGGQVAAACTPLNDALMQMATGKIRILATSGDKRTEQTPDVPTFVEQGFPQLVSSDYFTVFVHGKTPTAMQERLSGVVRKALTAPPMVAGFKRLFVEPTGSTPQEAVRLAQAAYEVNGRMVKAVGYSPE